MIVSTEISSFSSEPFYSNVDLVATIKAGFGSNVLDPYNRESLPHVLRIVHRFDWTFTPDGYYGTLWNNSDPKLTVEPTDQKINYEKLKEQERILFFDEGNVMFN